MSRLDDWARRLTPAARWTLAGLAGLLNGAAFIDVGWLALIANVPLLVALRGAPSASLAAGLGGLVGLLGGVHIYGILNYGWLLFVGFSVYTASQMIIYALLLRALTARVGRLYDVLLPALVWTLTEWIRTVGPLAMPASYVGCLADAPAMRPWLALAPITGGLGVSTLVALVQSGLYFLVFGGRAHRVPAVAALAFVGAVGAWGAASPPPLGDRPLTVAGVQGGLANPQYAAATRPTPAASTWSSGPRPPSALRSSTPPACAAACSRPPTPTACWWRACCTRTATGSPTTWPPTSCRAARRPTHTPRSAWCPTPRHT